MDTFARFPTWLFQAELHPYAKIIYCYLANEANIRKSNEVKIPIGKIASANNFAINTTRKMLRELENAGLIEAERNHSNQAPIFTIKDSFSPDDEDSDGCSASHTVTSNDATSNDATSNTVPIRPSQYDWRDSHTVPDSIHSINNYFNNIKEYSCVSTVQDDKQPFESEECTNDSAPQEEDRSGKEEWIYNTGYSESFQRFWDVYPKKRCKSDAYKAWKQMRWDIASPSKVNTLIQSVKNHTASHDWTKEDGRYIPFPAGYLRRGMWEDDVGENSGSFKTIKQPSYDTNLFKHKAVGDIKYRKRDTS